MSALAESARTSKALERVEVQRKQILCVHPHLNLKEIIPDLEAMYEVTYAQNGFDALQLYYKNKGKFDIILSGIIMSQMDGFSFVTRIRKITKKTPVYMIINGDVVDTKTRSFFSKLNVNEFFSIRFQDTLKEKLYSAK